jgi:predicted tellurium resistance membrane protein TerC
MPEFFAWMMTPEGWAALVTLAAMEIVLGIDNVVFISVLVAKLPPEQAERARKLGLLMALGFRIGLLFTITSIMKLNQPVLTLFGNAFSWRDLILLAGGLFLIAKATHEIHAEIEGDGHADAARKPKLFLAAIAQIAVIDLVFSIDSIVTAIGMVQDVSIMVVAVIISMAVMYLAAGAVSRFIKAHPTTKTLALSFLILIGVALCADAFGAHIPRGYIYFAMAFSASVEAVNILMRRNRVKAVAKSKAKSPVRAAPKPENASKNI